MQDLLRTIKIDTTHKFTGVTDDILDFDDIRPNKKWDYSYPTLAYNHAINYRGYPKRSILKFPDSLDEFKQRFFNNYPFLSKIDYNGILIAGGSIQKSLMGRKIESTNIDIDIFFINLTEDQAIDKIKYIAGLFDPKYIITYLRSSKALTIILDTRSMIDDGIIDENEYTDDIYQPIHLQFIFRIYSSPSEVLHGFDLASCSVGFDGNKLLFTTGSKFAYEYRCNYIHTKCRSTTYEFRLYKYWLRGFKIIFPNLKLNYNTATINLSGMKINRIHRKIKKEINRNNPLYIKNAFFGHILKLDYTKFSYPQNNSWITDSDYINNIITNGNETHMGFQKLINKSNLEKIMTEDIKQDINIFVANKNIDAILLNQLDMTDYINSKINKTINELPNFFYNNPTIVQGIRNSFNNVFKLINDFNERNRSKINFMISQKNQYLSAAFNPIIDDEFSWYGENNYIPNAFTRTYLILDAIYGDKNAIEQLVKYYSKDNAPASASADWFITEPNYWLGKVNNKNKKLENKNKTIKPIKLSDGGVIYDEEDLVEEVDELDELDDEELDDAEIY